PRRGGRGGRSGILGGFRAGRIGNTGGRSIPLIRCADQGATGAAEYGRDRRNPVSRGALARHRQGAPASSQGAGRSRTARITEPAAPYMAASPPSTAGRTVIGAQRAVSTRRCTSAVTGGTSHGASGAYTPPSTTVSTSNMLITPPIATPS